MVANTTNTLFSSAQGAAQNDFARAGFSEYVTHPEKGRSGSKDKYKRQSTGSKQGMYQRTKDG
jgi:hypothetical protein